MNVGSMRYISEKRSTICIYFKSTIYLKSYYVGGGGLERMLSK